MAYYYYDYSQKKENNDSSKPSNKPRLENTHTYRSIKLSLPPKTLLPLQFTEQQKNGDVVITDGQIYSLQGMSCEGYEMPIRHYMCKGIVNQFGGMDVQSAIMKQIDGKKDVIFSLTKNDCKLIGVDFEDGLQLFPLNMPWKLVLPHQEFDATDMGTYQVDPNDGTIHRIDFIICNVIKDKNDKYLKIGKTQLIDFKTFCKTVNVKFSDETLASKFPLITKCHRSQTLNENFIDENTFKLSVLINPVHDKKGINPKIFNGKTLDEILTITCGQKTELALSQKEREYIFNKLDNYRSQKINNFNWLTIGKI